MDDPFSLRQPDPADNDELQPAHVATDELAAVPDIQSQPDPIYPVQHEAAYWPAPPATPAAPAGVVQVDGVQWTPAGFWPRTGAFLLDMLILLVISQILVAVTGVRVPDFQQMLALLAKSLGVAMSGAGQANQASGALEQAEKAVQFASGLNIAVCAAYFTVMHGIAGATLGKLALGLRVMRRDGRPLGLSWAFLRYLGYLLLAKLAYSAWMIPLDNERRTLYDIVLTTNVYRKRTA